MNGRDQPYIDGNGTGTYVPTQWLDDVPGIQDGTPVDEQHLNNMETGINSANLLSEYLAEVIYKQQMRLDDVDGAVIPITLTNTSDFYTNNSVKTVVLPVNRDTTDYIVDPEIQGDVTNVGDIVIYDKQVNGFKVKYTGSAASVDLKLYVHGGNVE
jgi:hypothetical protein